ncbi:hypothetical protein FSB78_00455 [Sphingomonas ginsenosidivorax]|uniref:Sce7726 family protein n=1 Tax=Sphingomonas ginsenosidivorax TaxID=862135 RepID=A0A5C6U9M4_9SPHN|nr:hypothetical protein [Sphingomonas ginsenosidivorax]TXC69599.1 hypothetical protein FSB78_00455 [Sphingomonas ginsenosidivorax]
MDEGQVKVATLAHVRAATGRRAKPIVTAEFTLGSSGVRADLAVFAETTIGLEIKTAKDTLRRLASQMEAYCQHFNHAVAIVAPCHVPNVTAAHLHGAALWTYDSNGTLRMVKPGAVNVIKDARLAAVMTQAERRKGDFRTAIMARYAGTSQRFWSAVAGRSIRPDDLPLLSRFTDGREQARRLAAERDARWAHWLAAQDGPVFASA